LTLPFIIGHFGLNTKSVGPGAPIADSDRAGVPAGIRRLGVSHRRSTPAILADAAQL
jgi:hypothetical protein